MSSEQYYQAESYCRTASAGVVDVDYRDTWEQTYVACDVALYEAKLSGRNRVVSRRRQRKATAGT